MNKVAYTTFITALRPKLYRFSLSLLRRHETAEDVVQEVGLRLWKGIVIGNEHPQMEALAMLTAKNLCIDILRKNNRTMQKAAHNEAPRLFDQTPQHLLEEKETHTMICQLIHRLPLQQQMCIRLRDVEGYELEEIASILECDQGSVRTNLSRARKKIREQIIQLWNR
ncbi:MAG: RNA polymerase sigma factor [Prevotellaceae bacterium]|jgi:RNA polymerase sigma-70 factor (ECF subfamily)|nr:RNA polymerase sigma factor [Prevotellaceae bacterium]